MSLWNDLFKFLSDIFKSPQMRRAAGRMVEDLTDQALGTDKKSRRKQRSSNRRTAGASSRSGSHITSPDGYPIYSDRSPRTPLSMRYAPVADDLPDPGEVVWTWVPFEEDPTKGKDRPVLVLARERGVLVCLMLTSKDRGRGTHTDSHGNRWIDIGSGPWDPQRRASEVRINRLLRIDPESVRREGAALDADTYQLVADATRKFHRW